MRTAQARSIEAIHDRIAKLVTSVSKVAGANHLRNSGYASI
jgi:hypothetical protein